MISFADSGNLSDFYRRVYCPLKLRAKSFNTKRLYENTLANFKRFVGREPLLSDLDDDLVTGFMSWHIDEGNSADTANKEGGQILAIWRFACRKNYLTRWPDVEMLRTPKRIPQAWLMPEMTKLFEAAAEEQGIIGGFMASVWWRALLAVIFFTGERIGAVRDLTWDRVDLESEWVIMRAETRKGRRSDKAFPLPTEAVDLLRVIYRPGNGKVFPWDLHPDYIYKKYEKILERAGLPTDRKSKFHRIRRTTASYYKAAGGDPTELLDHADPRTTRKYLDPRICGDRMSAKVLKPPWKEVVS